MLRLTAERTARGLSKNRLAAIAGITPSDLSKIENRRQAPYPVQIEKLAKALGLPDDEATALMEEVEPVELGRAATG